ncbi:MAG TPA: adenosylmethionine--8-amino-7-oxononanoate transaminase [Pirellulaceae bacterium]|nr:adenosylmethionine--8-amino-7-oxononanoate transaminase [Pirellulaceae bacterium]HMO91345.1 adenosylmethionine--8-amino-7-oxononanoate transaminase [Pirellulaceae bacterium]HMP70263.1 adenosylmethionine--8-amino-7-oxononanoate transaminase [Pirellulaceae bacterium]
MSNFEWITLGKDHLWMPYTQMKTAPAPLPVIGTEGCEILLADGRRLLDAISSWWTAVHGYNHPYILAKISEQLQRMPHVMLGGLIHEPACQLAGRIAQLLPGDLNRVFFADSGSVAIEVALKIAVQYWLNQGKPNKKRFVCFKHAYHGDTSGAMSVGDPDDGMHAHFKGFLLEQFPASIPQDDVDWLEFERFLQACQDIAAGVIIEPLVQAAGGMLFHSSEQLRRLCDVVHKFDLLLIADEIATGFGRTGALFAIEHASIVPDLICLGKGLTGGTIGLAATIATDRVFARFYVEDQHAALMHGPTYMGNALACSAALASLDLFAQELRLAQAKNLERQFRDGLKALIDHPAIKDVRCLGAIAAIQFRRCLNKRAIMELAIQNGVWLRPINDVIYFMPAFVITDDQIQHLCDVAKLLVEATAAHDLYAPADLNI